MFARTMAAGAVFVACATLAGCGGGGGAPVKGKVVNGDKAYTPATDGDMSILLAGGESKSYTGKVEPDGTFTIKAADGGGVPAGKYKVSATKYPAKMDMKPGGRPPMPENKSLPEEWEVGGKSDFTLDASKLK